MIRGEDARMQRMNVKCPETDGRLELDESCRMILARLAKHATSLESNFEPAKVSKYSGFLKASRRGVTFIFTLSRTLDTETEIHRRFSRSFAIVNNTVKYRSNAGSA